MSLPRGNVFLAGVGGQGILLASEILGEAFLRGGYDVKKSEVHGMAQRGGAVTTHLRFGPKVYSPLIEPGTADVLIAFEKLEALRFIHFLKPGGTALVNRQEIPPAPVSSGQERYPERVEERLREAGCARPAGLEVRLRYVRKPGPDFAAGLTTSSLAVQPKGWSEKPTVRS